MISIHYTHSFNTYYVMVSLIDTPWFQYIILYGFITLRTMVSIHYTPYFQCMVLIHDTLWFQYILLHKKQCRTLLTAVH